eukprot:TRINITY_DN3802_c1_g1_i1.p1 TRINITY_DN3802_c1_g1~~TRINITY_DN3802_c1_g1_i1.p1  ORF type:complete len:1014 (+),score=99.04 TRINITY_DN3802_c1_g1_i1:45-3044(+)
MNIENRKTKAEYLKEKCVPELVNNMLVEMTEELADDPIEFLERWLRKKKEGKQVVNVGRKVSLSLVPQDADTDTQETISIPNKPLPSGVLKPAVSQNNMMKRTVSVAGGVPTLDDTLLQEKNAEKLKRRSFFTSMGHGKEVNPNVTCTHIGCLAMALTLVSGGKVTIEDIFFTLKLPLHYLKNRSMTLSELSDIAESFIQLNGDRFSNVMIAKRIFDVKLYDEEVTLTSALESNDTGARGPCIPLPQLAGYLQKETNSIQRCSVMHFDDLTAERTVTRGETDDEDEEPVVAPTIVTASPVSVGKFCVLQEFNPVKHEVTLCEPHFSGSKTGITKTTALLQYLYKSLSIPDKLTHRARGFLEVKLKTADSQSEPPPPHMIYHARLLAGTGQAGTRLMNVHQHISTHLVAVAFALHVLHGQNEKGLGQTGVDVAGLVRALRLPLSMVCDSDMPLLDVHDYASRFLELSDESNNDDTRIICRSMALKDAWDTEAAPSISMMEVEEEFATELNKNKDPSRPRTVIMVSFNVNVAHDRLHMEREMPSDTHYGIVVGYDSESSTVLIADVSPRKFSATWSVSLFKLYSAMVTKGYLVFRKSGSKEQPSSRPSSARSTSTPVDTTTFVVKHPQEFLPSFLFPPRVFSVTLMSVALTRLGFDTLPAEIATNSDYDISFLLSDKLTVNDSQRVLERYIDNILDNQVTVQTHLLDLNEHAGIVSHWEDFLETIWQQDRTSESVTILHFNGSMISPSSEFPGGYSGILTGYDSDRKLVSIMDANPKHFYRTWKVRVGALLKAVLNIDPESRRPRSLIRLFKRKKADFVGNPIYKARVKTHHPFKEPPVPHLKCMAAALSALGYPTSTENILYNMKNEIDLCRIKNTMTLVQCAEIACKYLVEKQLDHVKIATERLPALDSFAGFVQPCVAANSKELICVAYRPFEAHPGVDGNVGLAIIHHITPTHVHLTDINPTKYGHIWTQEIPVLYSALQPDCADPHYGVIKVVNTM